MNIEKFKKLGIQPVGINIESIDSHKSFCDLKSIDFPMLSDNEKIVSKKYNALNIFSSNKRKLVLINLQREIVYERDIFTLNYLKTEEILTGLKKLNII